MNLCDLGFAIFLGALVTFSAYKLLSSKISGYTQSVRVDVIAHHAGKSGTPTMGGLFLIVPLCLLPLMTGFNYTSLAILFAAFVFAKIGALDDMLKIKRGRGNGLNANQKILLMIFAAIINLFIIQWFDPHSTDWIIPFTKHKISLGWFWGSLLNLLVVLGTANAVNLTDGLDGLALFPAMLVFLSFMILAIFARNLDVAYAAALMIGGSFVMLWYNVFPAKIFLGDLGSLSIGGLIAIMAIILHMPLMLLFLGLLFVLEALSVIIQVISFKFFGRRVFKMSPIHHHFELLGWHESNVVNRLWLISFVVIILTLMFEVNVWL